jgi:DNA-binding transcriptional MerR regulator
MKAGGKGRRVEYRIDELARLAGTTVRNVRAYQDRGLLPSPRREGRVGLYSDAHLARLRLIANLLERGYTMANIAELVGAWENGHDIGNLLGFEAILTTPWSDERSVTMTEGQLAQVFAGVDEDVAATARDIAVRTGILEVDGDAFRVLMPGVIETGAVLVRAGVPLEAVMVLAQRMLTDIDDVARLFVDVVDDYVIEPLGELLPPERVPDLIELVDRLRPLAKQVVESTLSAAMDRTIKERFGERLERFIEAHATDATDQAS